ncbi:RNA polymerase sigma factor [Ruminococcus flavefaciens]|uniref:RNA polymerase sigma factor n=1 Tax=Ruminococcus flavefaciens TaxID=1265 RepID=UPI0013D9868C|nr:sigma-70 family RNA polymerase sigma factor [Ruminococcus flavefaciens]
MTHSEYRLLLKTDRTKAQRALFNEYLNYVYAIAYNRLHSCGSREDIGDCVLDVFMDVFSSYDEKSDLSGDINGFIGTVAFRKATNYYRKLCRNGVGVPLDEYAEAIPSDENIPVSTENSELRTILLDLIESLGKPDSTIIIEKYYYGRSSLEISKIVHISPIMVRVRSSRALKKLRKLLADKDITI